MPPVSRGGWIMRLVRFWASIITYAQLFERICSATIFWACSIKRTAAIHWVQVGDSCLRMP